VRIDKACDEFLRDCANVRKLSEHTTRAYRLDLARFTRFAGPGKEVTSFDRTVLPQYVEHLFTEHHLKETSAKRHVASVRSLFRWLEDGGHVPEDPFRGARVRIKLPRRLPRVLSRAELATSWNILRQKTSAASRLEWPPSSCSPPASASSSSPGFATTTSISQPG